MWKKKTNLGASLAGTMHSFCHHIYWYNICFVNSAASECKQELGGKAGTFTTPNYPQDYPLNVNCYTRIWAPAGYVIQVTFREFDVEKQAECLWDYVQVGHDQSEILFPDEIIRRGVRWG